MHPIPRGEDVGDTKSWQFDAVEAVVLEGKRQPRRSYIENDLKAVPQNPCVDHVRLQVPRRLATSR
jgi:hypothetical protein